MKCPYCKCDNFESEELDWNGTNFRKYQCEKCGKVFNTIEKSFNDAKFSVISDYELGILKSKILNHIDKA